MKSKKDIIGHKKSINNVVSDRGIYFLIKDNKIVYVGQSVNIFKRIKNHKRTKDFDYYNYILLPEVSDNRLNDVEMKYIAAFSPKYNKQIAGSDLFEYLFDLSKINIDSKNQKINIEITIINNKVYASSLELNHKIELKEGAAIFE